MPHKRAYLYISKHAEGRAQISTHKVKCNIIYYSILGNSNCTMIFN